MSRLLLALACVGSLAAMDEDDDHTFDLRLRGGLTSPTRDAIVHDAPGAAGGTVGQTLTLDGSAGPMLGVAVAWTGWPDDDVGWVLGAEGQLARHRGDIDEVSGGIAAVTPSGQARLDTATLVVSGGLAIRVPVHWDAGRDLLQLELTPYAGGGGGRAEIGGSGTSSTGVAWVVGARFAAVVTLDRRWQLMADVGYEQVRARVEWADTAPSLVTARGLAAGLGAGYRW